MRWVALVVLVGCGRIGFDPFGAAIREIAVGGDHACALRGDGTIACWGSNTEGELGIGTLGGTEPVPVAVRGVREIVRVGVAGSSSFAIDGRGVVWSWGHSAAWNLGVDDPGNMRSVAAASPALVDPIEVHGGAATTCGRHASGDLVCWGDGDAGQLGNGAAPDASPPVTVPLTARVAQFSMGADHACALGDGQLWCWGMNHFSQLGVDAATTADTCKDISNGLGPCTVTPMAIPGMTGLTAVVASSRHTCALIDGVVQCWGTNEDGQLGDAAPAISVLPVPVSLPAAAIGIALPREGSCALLIDGTAWCWGEGLSGELGNGQFANSPTPRRVDLAVPVRAIAANPRGSHVCALAEDDSVWCWGQNDQGQLGNDTLDNAATPVRALL